MISRDLEIMYPPLNIQIVVIVFLLDFFSKSARLPSSGQKKGKVTTKLHPMLLNTPRELSAKVFFGILGRFRRVFGGVFLVGFKRGKLI